MRARASGDERRCRGRRGRRERYRWAHRGGDVGVLWEEGTVRARAIGGGANGGAWRRVRGGAGVGDVAMGTRARRG